MNANSPTTPSRRRFLGDMATCAGGMALAWLLERDARAAESSSSPGEVKPAHFAPRARRVLQIFCPGAVSHIDTWEHKPELAKRHGPPFAGQAKLATVPGRH